MHIRWTQRASLFLLMLSLSSVAYGQTEDCSERTCSKMFEVIFKDESCRFLEATINNEPDLISGVIANFVSGCTNGEYNCEWQRDPKRCKRVISTSEIGTRESSGGEYAENGCPVRGKNVADGGCFTTEVVNIKDCYNVKAGACRNTAQCDDEEDIFGSFAAMCHSGADPGCQAVMGVVAEIRSTAHSRHASYVGRVNGAIQGVLASLSEEEKNAILSHITGIQMYSQDPGQQCFETYLAGAIDWSAGAEVVSGTGTEILVRAEVDGYERADQAWVMPDASPSSIVVSGTVKDETGKPIPNASVSLPDLGVIITTDDFGKYSLSAEADGSEPFSGTWDFVLTKKVGEVEVEVTLPKLLVVPSRITTSQPLTVTLLDCTDRRTTGACVSLPKGRVELEVINGDTLPFSQIQGTGGEVDSAGSYQTTLQLSRIDPSTIDLERLWQPTPAGSPSPLTLEIEVRAFLDGGTSPKKTTTVSIPFDLMMIKGTTVDAILLSRTEKEAPRLRTSPRSWIASQLSAEEDGVFYVLIQPTVVTGDPVLMWKETCNLQMNLPFSYLTEIRGFQPRFEPGAMLDVGMIDLLSPNEHEFRLRQWVREFLHAMGFDNGQLGWAIDSLSVLNVRYEVPGIPVPRYGMNPGMESIIGMAGVIQVGETENQYWGINAFADLDDPPYAIFIHELGHYVHKKIGDRWIEACLWDKKWAGSPDHGTWTTPTVDKIMSVEQGKMMTSFFEGTADFFAYSMFKFVEATHPEMKDSLYFQRGYLKGFDTADRALDVVHLGGCRVEGIQASFLRELYAPYLESQPARAFGDFLRMMDAYKNESWIMRWVPARTIVEWAAMKEKHGGLTPSSGLDGLIAKYAINNCDAGIMVYPADPKKPPRITIDGRTVTMTKSEVVQSLSIGQTVEIERGLVTVIVQVWDSDSPTTCFSAGPGTTFQVLSADQVTDQKGTLVVDGKIAVKTLGGTITPSGTSFAVSVADDGTAKARVLDGAIAITTRKGNTRFSRGQAASVSRKGKINQLPDFDPEPLMASYLTVVEVGPSPTAPETAATETQALPTPMPQAVSSTGLIFFAVRQKATGQCVVVAGTEGISPGDTIFGSFPTYQQTQQAVTSQCLGGRSANATAQLSASASPPRAAASRQSEGSAFFSPILALPKFDGDDSTKGIFFFNLDTGNAFFIDKVKNSPLSVRSRTLNQNIFKALGRTPGMAASPGEILVGEIRGGDGNVKGLFLVDSTTGAAAHISDLESRSYAGSLQPVTGRPADALTGDDGNYALIMKRDSSGKTEGAYLYHGTTGKTLYFSDIHKMGSRLAATPTTPLPKMEGRVSAVALESGSEATTGILLVDNGSGRIFHVEDLKRRPDQVTASPTNLDLFQVFPASAAVDAPQRFVLIPVCSGSGATVEVLVLDVGSGRLAVLRNARKPRSMRLQKLSKNIYDYLPKDVGRPRVIAAVPKVKGSGATEGAWIFDSASGDVLFIDGLDHSTGISIHRVDQKLR